MVQRGDTLYGAKGPRKIFLMVPRDDTLHGTKRIHDVDDFYVYKDNSCNRVTDIQALDMGVC